MADKKISDFTGASSIADTDLLEIETAAGNSRKATGAVVRDLVTGDTVKSSAKSTDIASSGTTDLATATGGYAHITGTTTITALGTLAAGVERTLRFAGILALTHNATSLILPGAANITTAAGDTAIFRSEGSGNWRCIAYTRASGAAVVSSGGDVGPTWTTNTLGSTSTLYGVASSYPTNETLAGAGGKKVEVEGYIYKAGDATARIGIGNGTNAVYLSMQGDNNVVLYRYSSSTETAITNTGANATWDFTGVYHVRLVLNIHSTGSVRIWTWVEGFRLPTTLLSDMTTFDMAVTLTPFITTSDTTKSYLRSRLIG